ncbi:MAG: phosphoribosylformylglycinamidine cyclo-ligase, partial [Bacillota bacterium]|nr:phosphoribosylformylglycinamidine cyclo-ligase [Bacillota bacterium]
DLVKGVSDGCLQSGCALIGGETAEMPGFYTEGEYDIAGFAAGIVEKDKIIDGSGIKDGDVLIGISSSGLHSNGYSLVRKLIPDINMDFQGKLMGETLLTPTKIYVKPVLELLGSYNIKGMAHITGGGFVENIPRMFKDNYTAVISRNSYPRPAIFDYLSSLGLEESHMYNTFNMGIGFVLCVDKNDCDDIIRTLLCLGENAYKIGYVCSGGDSICIE